MKLVENESKLNELLNRLEHKYAVPVHVMVIRTDDSGPVYVLKGGAEDYKKITSMQTDLYRLIKELQVAKEEK